MPLALFVISLVFTALISTQKAVEALSRHSANCASSSSSDVISKAEVGDCSASNADSAFMIFKGVCHDPFQKYVEEGG